MRNSEEMTTREFYQILEKSDKKHTEHIRRLGAKKRELFDLLGGKKPTENEDDKK